MTSNKPDGLKRKRDPTFVATEKMALLNLVEKHFAIVENKKTDTITIKNKNLEWQKIAEEFNATSPIYPREWIVLKNCWENMKKKAKSEQTARNQAFLGTGGGPPRKNNSDPVIDDVLRLIHTRVTGSVNSYDSDGNQILDATASEQVQDTNRDSTEATETATTFTVDWSHYTPTMLRAPVTSVLVASRSPSPEASGSRAEPPPQHQRASITPPRAIPAERAISAERAIPSATSRRRPILRRNREGSESLNAQRISMLLKTKENAEEEHALNISILRLQEQREQEILKQEKSKSEQEEIKCEQEQIKLEILKLQLKKLQD